MVATQLNREFGSGFVAHAAVDIDIELPVIRTRQVAASAAVDPERPSLHVLWRRLEWFFCTKDISADAVESAIRVT